MEQQKKLVYITGVYWFLLLYILAALVWWFVALNRQTAEMAELRLAKFSPSDKGYQQNLADTELFRKRKATQYTGEGFIFLLLIVVGALFVYRATRKQLQLARQQQNFMMAVTHELKTPIAITRLNLETLKLRKLDEKRQLALLQSAIAETERLNDLANNILLASRMEDEKMEHFSEVIDIRQPAGEMLRQFESRYTGRRFEGIFEEECLVNGDPLLLKIVLSNLLENAVKYTEDASPVTIKITKEGKKVYLKVSDLGRGIPEAEKERIFEKFYRLGNEFTRSAKGTGLGLYLCRRIVNGHKGKIYVEDNLPSGSSFVVVLPAALA